MAAGSQIRMVGKDQEPFDMSKEEYVEAFFKDMGNWSEKMSKDMGQYAYGYVDIDSAKPNPYGVVY